MYSLDICHLYPNLLNLYGDRGNVIALTKRAQFRGIEVNVHNISIGDDYEPDKYDITFLGGGQDFEQEIIQNDLINKKGSAICDAISNNHVFLAICGGYQLLGNYYTTHDGKKIDLLGAIDIWTIGRPNRLIGDFAFSCDILKSDDFDGVVVGFENHAGRTYLGKDVKPLGKLVFGNGNNGEDGFEGAIYKNVFCSYSHGSLLPKNPRLTDHILTLALKQKYPDFTELGPIDTTFEDEARRCILKRFDK